MPWSIASADPGRGDGAAGELAVDRVEHHEDEPRRQPGPIMPFVEQPGGEQAQQGPDQRHLVRAHPDPRRPAGQHQRPFRPQIFGEQVGHALIGAEIARPLEAAHGLRSEPVEERPLLLAKLLILETVRSPPRRALLPALPGRGAPQLHRLPDALVVRSDMGEHRHAVAGHHQARPGRGELQPGRIEGVAEIDQHRPVRANLHLLRPGDPAQAARPP